MCVGEDSAEWKLRQLLNRVSEEQEIALPPPQLCDVSAMMKKEDTEMFLIFSDGWHYKGFCLCNLSVRDGEGLLCWKTAWGGGCSQHVHFTVLIMKNIKLEGVLLCINERNGRIIYIADTTLSHGRWV